MRDIPFRSNRRSFIGLTAAALALPRLSAAGAQSPRAHTFAVLGLDTRRDDANQRADTIMVSRVDLDALTVRTLSIPRDLYVEIPGHGSAKINDAYQVGLAADPNLAWQSGAASTVATIEHNFGVTCNGVAVTELRRLPELIDAVGGIEVDNPYDVSVPDFPNFTGGGTHAIHFPEGPITLDGEGTMDFVRTRQQDGDGGRVMRQHLVLEAVLRKLQQPALLTNIPELVQSLSDIVHTDIPSDIQAQLIAAIPQLDPDSLAFTNIDELLWSDYTADGAWIYQGDWSTLPAYVQEWLQGTA